VRTEIIYCCRSLACAGRLFLVSSPFSNADNESGHVEKEANNQMEAWLPTKRVRKNVFNETMTLSPERASGQHSFDSTLAVRTEHPEATSGRKLQLMMKNLVAVSPGARMKPETSDSNQLYLGTRHRLASHQTIPLEGRTTYLCSILAQERHYFNCHVFQLWRTP
jgi:hypothetical protein